VDTGFIVFNRVNYPNLVALFEELDVPIAPSNMSFGVSARGGRLEYGLASIDVILAQRSNALRPGFLRMIRDMLRFGREAETAATPDMSIEDLIGALGLGSWFRDYYLTPFSGAIWSTPTQDILQFPARALVDFFRNHGLLGYNDQHQWFTPKGGSIQYVTRLENAMRTRGVDIRTGAPVAAIRRTATGVEVRAWGGEWELFDEIVMAGHSDTSLSLLSDATGLERTALSAIRFQPNEAILHSDIRVMPRRRKVWSSWVYTEGPDHEPDAPIGLSYWMNSLQPIPEDDPLFVTLNANRPIADERIHDVTTFSHPVFDRAAWAAQDTISAMNGSHRTWFCGAWMRNGFHEDGIATALDVTAALRAEAKRPRHLIAAE
jgi:predicted NAD/FAD-binding protein